jgi:hypothetical protein
MDDKRVNTRGTTNEPTPAGRRMGQHQQDDERANTSKTTDRPTPAPPNCQLFFKLFFKFIFHLCIVDFIVDNIPLIYFILKMHV